MKNYIKELICLSIVLLLLDIIWIGFVMNNHYSILIKQIQGEDLEFKPFAAILCYFVLIGGLYYFVIMRMKKNFDIFNVLSLSIPFGLTVYGVFDFTTASMLKNWDYLTAFADVLWGCFICSFSSIIVGLYRKYSLDDDDEFVRAN